MVSSYRTLLSNLLCRVRKSLTFLPGVVLSPSSPTPSPTRPPSRSTVRLPDLFPGFAIADCDRAFKEVGYEIDPVLNWLFTNV